MSPGHKHIIFNRVLLAGNLLVICLFACFYIWLEYYTNKEAETISNKSIVLDSSQPGLLNTYSYHLYSKSNIFDISRELWTIPLKKKKVVSKKNKKQVMLNESDIEGTMVLPMFSGIFVNGKFVKSGEKIKNTEIHQIKDGAVNLKHPDSDIKTYQLQKADNKTIMFFKKTE